MKSVIETAREAREALGQSQDQYAKRFGLHPKTYAQWERGYRRPDQACEVLLRVIVAAPEVVEWAIKGLNNA
jgi:putative transcriptional regulator